MFRKRFLYKGCQEKRNYIFDKPSSLKRSEGINESRLQGGFNESATCNVKEPPLILSLLTAALRSLQERGISFRGPFATSLGELIVVEDQILKESELIHLFEKGDLTLDGIRRLLASQGPSTSD
jgi:hypothetical protein